MTARLPIIIFVLAQLFACSQSDEVRFSEGACAQFGVDEPVPVPRECELEIAGEGDTARLFAVGAVIRYAEMDDYASFCSAWDEVVRTQVLPCLATDKPNLLVFPENATLAAAFVGSRGAAAREETESLPGFLSLLGPYDSAFRYYEELYPETAFTERLVLSLTDTLHRAFQTFPEIARTYGVYVAVSSDFAPAELSEDPADVSALADPDLEDVDSVYVATEGAAFNWGIYFDPDGREVGRVAKSYLVPAEEDLLSLTHGPLVQAKPVELPFARTGMVISKDAWMPGLLERLDALGAQLMLQPEAFSGWAVEEFQGDWLPDIVRQSGWAHTQRHAGFRHNVTPCIKGNLLDLVFDCQSHVTQVTGANDAPRAFIGQDPYAGLPIVEPWVIEDPGPPASLEERRAILRDRGERMLPGSGDPLEDSYEARAIAFDLDLPSDGRFPETGDGSAGELGPSAPIAPPRAERHHQRFPTLALVAEAAVVAWMEGAPGEEQVRIFESREGPLQEVPLPSRSGTVQRLPRAAAEPARSAVVWEEESEAGTRIVISIRRDTEWETEALTDPAVSEAWAPDVVMDAATGRIFVTWLDLRDGGRAKPWLAWSDEPGSWTSLPVDSGNPIENNPRGDAAFVRVATRDGRVFVAFSDFREFSWDIYLSISEDGGESFAAATRINPTAMMVTPVGGEVPVESERLHGDVALGIDPTGNPVVAWTERQDRRYESQVRLWRAGVSRRIDDAPPGVDAWRPAIAITDSAEIYAVWQDLRGGTNGLRMAKALGPDLDVAPSLRIDDAAEDAHAYAPRAAARGEEVWIVWEDPRSGYSQVHLLRSSGDPTTDASLRSLER
jgi:predicted amidohydrolase